MLESNETSVILKQAYQEFSNELNNKDLTAFSKLKNDFERFDFIHSLLFFQKYKIKISDNRKNLPEAKLLKEKGNSAFQSGDYKKALSLYSKSLMKSPLEKENGELSIIRANRSAALHHLEKHQLAIVDIEAALAHGYPKDMMYKLKDRKARCLLALKQNKAGLAVLQETLTALDDAKLPLERRLKWQKDIQIMIALMTKNKVMDEKMSASKKKQNKLDFNKNSIYPAASDAIEIKYSNESGRYAEAKREIKVGELLLIEESHCAVLLENKVETHCFHCMKRVEAGEPCETCDKIKFCSTKCQKEAMKSHHAVECQILESLWQSGISVTCLMALRIISQRRPDYFRKLQQEIMKINETKTLVNKKYSSADYLTVTNLVTHEDRRTADGLLHKAFMASYLLRCLKEASYFEGIHENELNEYTKLIGGLLLKNLQVLQFNAHEVSELETVSKDLNASKSTFIGGGLYPTLALFNHSCNPSLVRYFEGTKVITRAIRPIKVGEMVAENYGPIFTEMEKPIRRKQLRENYWFDCGCEACVENWPLLKDTDSNSLRFRCENKDCTNIIVVPATTMEFMIKCPACNKHTNLLKGLKVLQDTDNLFRLGNSFLKNGEPDKAEYKFMELIELLDGTLAPPFKDYHLCQEGLRKCFLTYGNMCKLYHH